MQNKYTMSFVFDVTNGNPNGNPDSENEPRVRDYESGLGVVTDVCLKRKIRDTVSILRPDTGIYITKGSVLAPKVEEFEDKKAKKKGDLIDLLTALSNKYYDIRTFGAVVTRGKDNGGLPINGPVQISYATSVAPITVEEDCITRCCVQTEKEAEKGAANQTMGRRFRIPYAVYKANVSVNPFLAEKTGFNDDDLKLLVNSIQHMFEFDRSSARPEMNLLALVVWKHNSRLGNAPEAYLWNEGLKVITTSEAPTTRDHYKVLVKDALPEGVTVDYVYTYDEFVRSNSTVREEVKKIAKASA